MGYLFVKMGLSHYLCNVTKKQIIMNKRFLLLAKFRSSGKFFIKVSHNERDMVSRSEMIYHKDMGDIIAHFVEKKSGHRYLLDIKDCENPDLGTNIKFCTKKIAKFAKKALEEHDETLKIDIIKLY